MQTAEIIEGLRGTLSRTTPPQYKRALQAAIERLKPVPVTTEWLESVGFIVSDGGPVYWRFEIGDVWVAHCPATGRWWIDDVNWAGITVPNIATRDDVRALVRMLGGGLNESEES